MFRRKHALNVIKKGHVGRKCPNLKPIDVEKRKKKSDVVKQMPIKFESKQTWKPKASKGDSQQNWKQLDRVPTLNSQ
ncbi:hypothetical protein Hanom_Chr07g00621621 [Helianthus anomalus]